MRTNGKVFFMICMAGFLGGIICANTLCKEQVLTTEIFNTLFFEEYLHTEIRPAQYFWYLVPARILPLAVLALLGQVRKLRRTVVFAALAWTCFLSGIFFSAAVIRLGALGIFFCMVSVLPQIIFYAAGYGILLWYFYLYPHIRWNGMKMFVIILTISAGMIVECYINPIFLKIFLKII